MRVLLKTIIAIVILVLSGLWGVYMLFDMEIMKIIIWAISCGVLGHGVYRLMRIIDKKFPNTK